MPNEKTDSLGFATENADQLRDNSAKGGPMAGVGKADSKHTAVKSATEDRQTNIAAESNKESDTDNVRSNN